MLASVTIGPGPPPASGAMGPRQVGAGLHLGQPAAGALELECEAAALVQRVDGRDCGKHQLDAAVVELVDQRDEAPCLVVERGIQLRHPGQHDGVEGVRNWTLKATRSIRAKS